MKEQSETKETFTTETTIIGNERATTENLLTKNVLPTEIPDRKYKDRVFRMVFNDRERLLELYNAMNGTAYTNTDDLTVTTLENALYLGMKNDISYVLHDQLLLYEHQSTKNPNMPLRNLLYVADVYSKLMKDVNLFSRTLRKIPEPKFFVFYNGTEAMPEHTELRLSAAYETARHEEASYIHCGSPQNRSNHTGNSEESDVESNKVSDKESEEPSLELVTQVLNINKGFNEGLKEHCRTLKEYMIFVDTVREYAKKLPFGEAMSAAIDTCIRNHALEDFLKKNRAEVLKVSLYEYDEEKQLEMERSEAEERGRAEGRAEGRIEGKAEGRTEGEAIGEARGRTVTKSVFKLHLAGSSPEEIAKKCGITVEQVLEILE